MCACTSIVTHDAVSYNAKVVRGNGWAEGLEVAAGRNPLHVAGRRGRVRRSGVSGNYKRRFRSLGILVDWLRAHRKGEHKGQSEVRRYRCSSVMVARLEYERKRREDNRKRAVRRSRTTMRRKAKELYAKTQGNVYMLTLTYAENMEDFGRACQDLRNFIRRVNYRLDRKCDYIAVPERQKRGAWHWHILIDVYMDWKEWERIWGHGFIWVRKVRNLTHAIRYVVKYVAKTFEEGGVRVGQHRYLCSKGLNAWSVEYVAVEEELATWFYFRQENEGYKLMAVVSNSEKGFVWWEAVNEELEGLLDIKDEFVRNSCGGGKVVV